MLQIRGRYYLDLRPLADSAHQTHTSARAGCRSELTRHTLNLLRQLPRGRHYQHQRAWQTGLETGLKIALKTGLKTGLKTALKTALKIGLKTALKIDKKNKAKEF